MKRIERNLLGIDSHAVSVGGSVRSIQDIAARSSGVEVGASLGVGSGLDPARDGSLDADERRRRTDPADAKRVAGGRGRWDGTYFRLYGPLESYFDRSWHLLDIEKVR